MAGRVSTEQACGPSVPEGQRALPPQHPTHSSAHPACASSSTIEQAAWWRSQLLHAEQLGVGRTWVSAHSTRSSREF